MTKNYDMIKNFSEDELSDFFLSLSNKTVTRFVDIGDWLGAPEGTEMYEHCGKPGIFYDTDSEKNCRIIEHTKMMGEEYVRILVKKEKEDDCQIFSVPAHRVREI